MCLKNTDDRGANKIRIWQKSLSPKPGAWDVSEVCEQSVDGLTVHVWLLYHHPNFKYCTLFESGSELWTDKLTDKQNGQTDRRSNY